MNQGNKDSQLKNMRILVKLTLSELTIETEYGSRKFTEKIVDDWMFSNSSNVRLVYWDLRDLIKIIKIMKSNGFHQENLFLIGK